MSTGHSGRRFGFTRRQLLERLGLGAAGGLILPHLPVFESEAEAAGEIRRIVFFVTGNGTTRVKGNNTAEGNPWGAGLNGAILKHLAPFKSQFALFTGMTNKAANAGAKTHEPLRLSALTGYTGTGAGNSADVGGPSIDWTISQGITASTKYKSLVLNCQSAQPFSFKGPQQPNGKFMSPDAIFDNANFPATGTMPPPADPRKQRRVRIFNYLKPQIDDVKKRVGKADLVRMDAHYAALDEIQRQEGYIVSEGCKRPDGLTFPSGVDWLGSDGYRYAPDLYSRIMAAVFACDMARVGVICLGNTGNTQLLPSWIPGFEELTIAGKDKKSAHSMAHASTKGGVAATVQTRLEEWHAQRFLALVTALDQYVEAGESLLKKTLVVWVNSMATGNHKVEDMPCLVVGGGGRIINNDPNGKVYNFNGRSTNDFFLTLSAAMGVMPANGKFGDPAFCAGVLPGVLV